MEQIAFTLKKPALDIKRLNFVVNNDKLIDGRVLQDSKITEVTDELIKISEYEKRLQDVEQFNKVNKWRKKGMAFSPLRHPVDWGSNGFNCNISIFHGDG